VNALLALPMEVRLALLFVVGIAVGGLINVGIYRLAWNRRAIGPWLRPHSDAPARRLRDCLPIIGWLGLRREAPIHGRGFWIRPMLLELLVGAGFAALYWWEIDRQGLLPSQCRHLSLFDVTAAHQAYVAHIVLFSLMLVVSCIDIDEKTIPDAITVPGALVGLGLAILWPRSSLPIITVVERQYYPTLQLDPLTLASPNSWPVSLDGFPHGGSLMFALACLWLWCAALLPRRWYGRHGIGRALRLIVARCLRDGGAYLIVAMGLTGSVVIAWTWYASPTRWATLLSALLGMAVGGGLVWIVRVIGAAILKREAMGFGDVTLMAMIGAFLGWQTAVMIFFLAPFAGLVIGAAQWIARGEPEIPYGPFLCLAALASVIAWAILWEETYLIFGLGWIIAPILLGCMALMIVLLPLVRAVMSLFR